MLIFAQMLLKLLTTELVYIKQLCFPNDKGSTAKSLGTVNASVQVRPQTFSKVDVDHHSSNCSWIWLVLTWNHHTATCQYWFERSAFKRRHNDNSPFAQKEAIKKKGAASCEHHPEAKMLSAVILEQGSTDRWYLEPCYHHYSFPLSIGLYDSK